MSKLSISLAANGRTLDLGQTHDGAAGLFVNSLEGWWGTPSAKVELTERSSGDGAHAVTDDAVLYSARTVSIGVTAYGSGRGQVAAAMNGVLWFAHRVVDVTVDDGEAQTRASGYVEVEFDGDVALGMHKGTLTIVCPDPRRYGTERVASIVPTGDAGGGLLYEDGAGYLLLPIQFAGGAPTGNSATLANEGTSTAYPIITVEGSFPAGVTITHAGGQLAYTAPIGLGAPLVLDSLTRTASVLGVDVTRALTRRDFPAVHAGGTVTISALAEGTGTVIATVRDTYV